MEAWVRIELTLIAETLALQASSLPVRHHAYNLEYLEGFEPSTSLRIRIKSPAPSTNSATQVHLEIDCPQSVSSFLFGRILHQLRSAPPSTRARDISIFPR